MDADSLSHRFRQPWVYLYRCSSPAQLGDILSLNVSDTFCPPFDKILLVEGKQMTLTNNPFPLPRSFNYMFPIFGFLIFLGRPKRCGSQLKSKAISQRYVMLLKLLRSPHFQGASAPIFRYTWARLFTDRNVWVWSIKDSRIVQRCVNLVNQSYQKIWDNDQHPYTSATETTNSVSFFHVELCLSVSNFGVLPIHQLRKGPESIAVRLIRIPFKIYHMDPLIDATWSLLTSTYAEEEYCDLSEIYLYHCLVFTQTTCFLLFSTK